MTSWPADTSGAIVHLEDEPEISFAQIVAEGLRVGQIVRIVESTPDRIVLTDGEHEFRLAPAVAANVFVAPAPDAAGADVIVTARRISRRTSRPKSSALDGRARDSAAAG